MMVTRADIIAEARTWVGTPFHHQGRLKGVGVDCAGVIVGVAHALGLSDYDRHDYGREPYCGMLRSTLDEHMHRVQGDPLPGDVLLMAFDREEQHLAILTDQNTIIHAYEHVGRCVEHRYADVWRARTRGVYRYKGVE